MKKFTQGVALVAVTTLFVSAFTTSHWDKQSASNAPSTALSTTLDTNPVAQVVITGKRMTAIEKAQYDAETLAQKTSQPIAQLSDQYQLAVK